MQIIIKFLPRVIWIKMIILFTFCNLHCDRCNKKAEFKICSNPLSLRDIVFIMDQSGTMFRNDSLAIRWDAVGKVIEGIFRDEESSNPGTHLNRIAVIPFGKDSETEEYNVDLKWFNRSDLIEAIQFIKTWYQRAKRDTATYSDFYSPFSLLSNRLKWRNNAKRYIFFISDGKFNVLPNVYKREEERRFEVLLNFLEQNRNEWPVYFIGMGKPGFDRRNEPYIDEKRLKKMAQAIPLPHNLLIKELPTTYFEPTRLTPNSLINESTDFKEILKNLRQEIEHILRGTRFADTKKGDDTTFFFPIIHPNLIEVEVCAKEEIRIDQLAQKIDLFVETKKAKHYFEPLKLIFSGNGLPPSHLHRFQVDTVALNNKIPDWYNLKSIKSWGLKTKNEAEFELTEVNLIIKDNWSVFVDTCFIKRVPNSRTWWERIFHKPTQPTFKLFLNVRAVHPCGGVLPCGQMNVLAENEKIINKNKALNFDDFHEKFLEDDSTHTYYWKSQIINCEEFKKNIGSIVRIGIEVEDLYACNLQIPIEVPVNARVLNIKQ